MGKFRVTLVAVSRDGKYGMHTSYVQVQRPFNAVLNYPKFIRQNDQVLLDLILQNNTE